MVDLPANLGELPAGIQELETKNAIDRLQSDSAQTASEADIHKFVDLIETVSTETARENLSILLYITAPGNPTAIRTRVDDLLDYAKKYPAARKDLLWAVVAAIDHDTDTAKRLLDQLGDTLDPESERLYGVAVLAHYLAATADDASKRARTRLRAAASETEGRASDTAPEIRVASGIAFDESAAVTYGTETILRRITETETRLLRNVQLFLTGEAASHYPDAVAGVVDEIVAKQLFELLRVNPDSTPVAYAVTRLVIVTGDEQLINQLEDVTDSLSETTREFINTILEAMTDSSREMSEPFGLGLLDVLQIDADGSTRRETNNTDFNFSEMRLYVERLRIAPELTYKDCERRARNLRQFVSENEVPDSGYKEVLKTVKTFETDYLPIRRPDNPSQPIREQDKDLYREISERVADVCDDVAELYKRSL